jgi:hypothetical protein
VWVSDTRKFICMECGHVAGKYHPDIPWPITQMYPKADNDRQPQNGALPVQDMPEADEGGT